MEGLRQLVGRERSLGEVTQSLYFSARALHAPMVGALHVTCSDESENECVEVLHQGFAQYLLPTLKFARHASFRVANLGGRYEWSAVRLAASSNAFKLLVIKVNAHVAFEELPRRGRQDPTAPPPFRLGAWKRYGRESSCCGALSLLLRGARQPYVDQLREEFGSEGRDRLEALQDPARVEPLYAPLYAAIVSARLQARKAVLDIQDYAPESPTYYVVLPCVTVNRHERDTEIVCGIYTMDGREGGGEVVYSGLGDDPAAFATTVEHKRFSISDDQLGKERQGRDHRAMMREVLRERAAESHLRVHDERLERVRADVARNKHRHHHHARTLLRVALPVLAEVAPVPAALLAFGDGAVGIHHAFKVHRLAREMEGTAEARRMLDEIEGRIDQLDGDRAEALLELLMADYK
jgi:hypothetical protein